MLYTVRFLQTLLNISAMCICVILHLHRIIHLISVTLLQNDQNGEQIQKSQA